MPTIKRTTNLAAGATASVLQGSQYEYLPFAAMVEFAIVSDVVDVDATVYSGSDVLLEQSELEVLATPPQYPEHFYLDDVAAQGERLSVQLSNRNAGAAVVTTIVRITPL